MPQFPFSQTHYFAHFIAARELETLQQHAQWVEILSKGACHSLFLRLIRVPFMKPGMKSENKASKNEDYKRSRPRWIFIAFEGSFLDKMP